MGKTFRRNDIRSPKKDKYGKSKKFKKHSDFDYDKKRSRKKDYDYPELE